MNSTLGFQRVSHVTAARRNCFICCRFDPVRVGL
jgi:hypothetical protein